MFRWDEYYARFINLDTRQDRLKHMQIELERVGIVAERERGIYPEEIGRSDKVETMWRRSKGAVGCHFSQVKVIKDAAAQDKHPIVFEDDLVFASDVKDRLDYIQHFMDTHEWDVFFLGGTVHINPPVWHGKGHTYPELKVCDCGLERDAELTDTNHILRVYGMFSTHAYVLNKHSVEKILSYFDEHLHESIGIDFLLIKMQPQIKAFCFLPGSVKQYDNQSNIGHGFTYFSGFAALGAHWWQDRVENFNFENYNWAEAKRTL